MDNEKKNLKVYIFGSEYTLKTEEQNSEIFKIAEHVDQKMREIHAAKLNRPLHQIAILVALNIAEELFHLRQQGIHEYSDLQEKIKELTNKLKLGIEKPLEADEHIREL
jgi:cell division protein ZapA